MVLGRDPKVRINPFKSKAEGREAINAPVIADPYVGPAYTVFGLCVKEGARGFRPTHGKRGKGNAYPIYTAMDDPSVPLAGKPFCEITQDGVTFFDEVFIGVPPPSPEAAALNLG